MKKIFWLLFLFLPFIVKADYKIENYTIDMTILENGNIEVMELFQLSGDYNGFDRTIFYKNNYTNYYGNSLSSTGDASIYNGNNVVLKEARGITFDPNKTILEMYTSGDVFQKKVNAKKGEYGVYTITGLENGEQYLLYNSSRFNKDFYFAYTLENMAIFHHDIAELGMNLFPKIRQDIHHFTLYIHIPNNKRFLKLWAHGNATKVENLDLETVKVSTDTLLVGTSFDFRLIFDKDVISKSIKKDDNVVFDTILEIENKFSTGNEQNKEYQLIQEAAYSAVEIAEKNKTYDALTTAKDAINMLKENDELKVGLQVRLLNLEPKIEKKQFLLKTAYSSVGIGWSLILLMMIVYHYTKRDKKSKFEDKYYQELPSYSPSSVGYLLHRKLTIDDLCSSVLLLIDSKQITFEKQAEDYILTKKKNNQIDKESDTRLLKFLFGDANTISLSQLDDRSSEHYSDFLTDYSNWFNQALLEAEAEEFYEDVTGFKVFGVIYSIIGVIAGILLLGKSTYFPSGFLILVGILAIFYFILFAKHTVKGRIETSKWHALKHFMLDFSKMDKKKLPKKSLWGKYLIYAIPLGCMDKLEKNMGMQSEEEIPYYIHFTVLHEAIKHMITSAVSIAHTSLNHVDISNRKS